MAKIILFKIWKFPQLSETFVVNQIVTAIKLDYDVKILVEEPQNFEENSNIQLVEKFKIREKVVREDYKIPKKRFVRLLQASLLLLGFTKDWASFKKFCGSSPKKNVSLVYKFNFYRRFKKIDVFHVQFGTNKHPLDLLKKSGMLRGKLIVSFHGHDLYFPINNRILNNGYYNHLFETADYLVCNTSFLKEKLLELDAPSGKIEVIPVAVDTSFFKPLLHKNSSQKMKLVSVGRLETFKGHIWGIRAVHLLAKKGYNVFYQIAGSGSLDGKLKKEVENLNLEVYVGFLGRVTQEEVKELLQKSTIFMMTSITDPDYGVESQGLVTAEAQACGLPVVAFNSGGIKYTLKDGETGFLCKEKDVESFASKIEALILNEDLRKRMSEKAVQFVEENYSEKSVMEKWKELYG